MKQTLQLRIGQQLAMTPQLRQAIHLLQLSTLDLKSEVQEALDSNLMLEEAGDDFDETAEQAALEDSAGGDEPPGLNGKDRLDRHDQAGDSGADEWGLGVHDRDSTATASSSADADVDAEFRPDERSDIPDDPGADFGWDEIYDSGQTSYSAPADDEGRDIFETRRASPDEGLHEQLIWQLDLTPFSDVDRVIAEAIIDSIDDDGYLRMSLEDILDGLMDEDEAASVDAVTLDEVEAVLHRIQHFDPIGVGARDLSECLQLQLRALPVDTPNRDIALLIVKRYLEILGARDLKQLMRRLKLEEDTLNDVIALIRSLDPKPGARLTASHAEYIVPDVFVRKVKGSWQVEPNVEAMPRLRINSMYASMVRRADNSPDNSYLRNHLQEARWFIKSLQSRHETLLKVARAIVARQVDFFEEGDEGMKPLVLRDIAEAVDMHESTISRVTTQKYMHTPRGIFEFKYFFSSHVGTADGGECSATAIRAMIRKMTSAEDPAKPLSDSKIASLLDKQGIQVARRTVAKYRESMSIPPSNERKRLS
ncbi:MAG: RNA polymerase factor sigma-54 [Chromatiales bacterium]|nr:RNA polymerase factor sigma-54 [Gammaproteobacteria bacterium]MCP5353084.1 RNA polymerase factor sigma-54 [Chromatiales bacterium]